MTRRSPRCSWKLVLLRGSIGIVAALCVIEVVVRIATHSLFLWGVQSDRYVTVDPMVGRIPKSGISIHHPKGFNISLGEYGTRLNRNPPPQAERPLTLVVGDSFAFSDQVNDEDSWPAVLERLSGRRVVNAGVPGFGLDQAILRAEQLGEIFAPDTIVVSFIPHDVLRCEMSYWSGHAKPYFDIEGTALHLHPAPVPPPPKCFALKQILSFSVTIDLLFPRFLHWDGPESTVVHHQGKEVACRLMARLAAFAHTHGARVVVLAQPQAPDVEPAHLEIKSGVLACAQAHHLATLDLFPVIESLPPEQRAQLFDGHMTVEGNRLVAAELKSFLERSGLH